MNLERIRENLESVRIRIAGAARRAGRDPRSVTLVAVTKKNPTAVVRPLLELGAADLGENYPQELWRKIEEIADPRVRWHLIGHLQRNKAKRTLPMVAMIHSVDSLTLLRALDDLAVTLELTKSAAVCLQVNTSGEPAKHGWTPDGLLRDAEAIAACRRIPIVGLMTLAAFDTTADEARPSFASLCSLQHELRRRTDLALPHLSMGMSNDFEAAVEEGATLVRVGSALFEGVFP